MAQQKNDRFVQLLNHEKLLFQNVCGELGIWKKFLLRLMECEGHFWDRYDMIAEKVYFLTK